MTPVNLGMLILFFSQVNLAAMRVNASTGMVFGGITLLPTVNQALSSGAAMINVAPLPLLVVSSKGRGSAPAIPDP